MSERFLATRLAALKQAGMSRRRIYQKAVITVECLIAIAYYCDIAKSNQPRTIP